MLAHARRASRAPTHILAHSLRGSAGADGPEAATPAPEDAFWVTVFGFMPDVLALVLRELQPSSGAMLAHRQGGGNWVYVRCGCARARAPVPAPARAAHVAARAATRTPRCGAHAQVWLAAGAGGGAG